MLSASRSWTRPSPGRGRAGTFVVILRMAERHGRRDSATCLYSGVSAGSARTSSAKPTAASRRPRRAPGSPAWTDQGCRGRVVDDRPGVPHHVGTALEPGQLHAVGLSAVDRQDLHRGMWAPYRLTPRPPAAQLAGRREHNAACFGSTGRSWTGSESRMPRSCRCRLGEADDVGARQHGRDVAAWMADGDSYRRRRRPAAPLGESAGRRRWGQCRARRCRAGHRGRSLRVDRGVICRARAYRYRAVL